MTSVVGQTWTVVDDDEENFQEAQNVFPQCSNSNISLGNYFCNKCQRTYVYKRDLQRHQKFSCGKEPQFQCSSCLHRYVYKHDLNAHIKRKHSKHIQC